MKTEITLEELLKQITPLPYGAGPRIEGLEFRHIRGGNNHRVAREVDTADAAYLTHCANVLPELVEAVRNHLKGDIRGTSVFRNHKPLRQALSRAEKVTLP